MKTASCFSATLLLLLTAAAPLPGQDTLVTATMLRAVAERADQYRTGMPVYLVAEFRPPHRVHGPYRTMVEARRAAGAGSRVFGPYTTPSDEISDSVPRVIAVRLALVRGAGDTQYVNVNPDSVDALFFTMVAVDKFVIPYYTGLYGPKYAARLRLAMTVQRPKGHCVSIICDLPPDAREFRPVDFPYPDGAMGRDTIR